MSHKNILGVLMMGALLGLIGCAGEEDVADDGTSSDEVVAGQIGAGSLLCKDGKKSRELGGDSTEKPTYLPVPARSMCSAVTTEKLGLTHLKAGRDPLPGSNEMGILVDLQLRDAGTTAAKFKIPTAKISMTSVTPKKGKTYYAALMISNSGAIGYQYAESKYVDWNGKDQTFSLSLKDGYNDVRRVEGGAKDALYPMDKVKVSVGIYEYDTNTKGRNHRPLARVESNLDLSQTGE